MALTDNRKFKERARLTPKAPTVKDGGGGWWSDEQKRELVNSYLVTGNLALSARIMNVPEITARKWKASAWWKEIEQEIKVQDKIELSGKLRQIIDKSLAVVEDRLINGDYQYDPKTGQVVRRPVNVRDANNIATNLMTKREVLENRQTDSGITEEGLEARLVRLAEKFAAITKQKQDEARTIDVTDVTVKENT